MSLAQKIHLALKIHSYDRWIPQHVVALSLDDAYFEAFNTLDITTYIYSEFNSSFHYSIVDHPNYMDVFNNGLFREHGMSLCVIPDIDNVYTENYTILKPKNTETNIYAIVPQEWLMDLSSKVVDSILIDFELVK